MQFRIAASFQDSLARLTAAEQRAAKVTAYDMQMDMAAPGLRLHRVEASRDPDFWSARVNDDLRIILHRAEGSVLLAYVGHHDTAYAWAERRRIEQHPTTGAMQLVEVRERTETPAPAPGARGPFAALSSATLLGLGVPADWVETVRGASEATLLDVLRHLPDEAQEALLRVATGEPVSPQAAPAAQGFAHPDAQRRFRVLHDVDALARALDAPWATWAVFLHPAQRALVERRYAGPARVTGSAGTGKTVVALHRAAHVARSDASARVLLATFSKPLARALASRLALLLDGSPEVAARIEVATLFGAAYALHQARFGAPQLALPDRVQALLRKHGAGTPFSAAFLWDEWATIVDAQQTPDWETYRDAARIGRRARLGEKQRQAAWAVFAAVREALAAAGQCTVAQVFSRVAAAGALPYTHAVVDEAQDLSVPEARFLAALGGGRPDALFLAGDLGQRIFQPPFSWRAMGLDVRGRSHALRLNYRTSHQIREQADRLLPPSVADVDGLAESRRGTVSLFDGVAPEVSRYADAAAEAAAVGAWVAARLEEGTAPHEVGVLVRGPAQVARARRAVKAAGAAAVVLEDAAEPADGRVSICPMHLAKGLEFRAVAVIACDEDVLPLAERIGAASDEAALEAIYETERHLLYVACTRARDRLWVSGVRPGSEFLRDLVA